MVEYVYPSYASLINSPEGESSLVLGTIKDGSLARSTGNILLTTLDVSLPTLSPNSEGVAHVEMNHSGKLELAKGEEGILATTALSGCTGLAGIAHLKDGKTLQFLSHYAPIAERKIIDDKLFKPLSVIGTGQSLMPVDPSRVVPSPMSLGKFYDWAREEGAVSVDMFIAYGKHHPETYFDLRHYFTLHGSVVASRIAVGNPLKRTLLLPYDDDANILAVGRSSGSEGIFWNGVKIGFDDAFKHSEL